MDAILMFDVLMYLNIYYYLLAAICHPVMVIAKYFSPNYDTPQYIHIDVAVVVTMVVTDLFKILIYRKLREKRKVVAVVVGLSKVQQATVVRGILLHHDNIGSDSANLS
ncbi:hypothetical protein Trydic_g9803 [Trypoxylus dichotomus]